MKVLSEKKSKSLEPPKKKIKLDDNEKDKKGVKFDSNVQVKEIERDDESNGQEEEMEAENEEFTGEVPNCVQLFFLI